MPCLASTTAPPAGGGSVLGLSGGWRSHTHPWTRGGAGVSWDVWLESSLPGQACPVLGREQALDLPVFLSPKAGI